jgi:hypothetical protein
MHGTMNVKFEYGISETYLNFSLSLAPREHQLDFGMLCPMRN